MVERATSLRPGMRVVVVVAHPDPNSFSHAITSTALAALAITSRGSSRFVNIVEGETGPRVIGRTVRVLCHRFARTTWLALYDTDRSTAEDRRAFLDRVEQRLRRL